MKPQLMDIDVYLSGNEQWSKLDQEWGIPVDLDTEDDNRSFKMTPVLSSLDLRKSTFDSSFLMKKVRRKAGRKLSSTIVDYNTFIDDLGEEEPKELPLKKFYFISGQILSALSVEEICDKIDDIFQSIEKLCSATSTLRQKRKLPEIVHCSISEGDLSFDDTMFHADDEKEKSDTDDVDKYIDEAFNELNSTVEDMASPDNVSRESVTTLVRKFSSILSSPKVKKNPRRKRQCCDNFKKLADFWQKKAFGTD